MSVGGRYDTFGDYMDMSMQCGYVLLFSVAWPFTAVCAGVNNVLELRADLFRVTLCRRAIPRPMVNIGNWLLMLKIGVFVALFFVSFLFTMSTGGPDPRLPVTLTPTLHHDRRPGAFHPRVRHELRG